MDAAGKPAWQRDSRLLLHHLPVPFYFLPLYKCKYEYSLVCWMPWVVCYGHGCVTAVPAQLWALLGWLRGSVPRVLHG